jgi:hypothetical protein
MWEGHVSPPEKFLAHNVARVEGRVSKLRVLEVGLAADTENNRRYISSQERGTESQRHDS